jgi:hypothetical protein
VVRTGDEEPHLEDPERRGRKQERGLEIEEPDFLAREVALVAVIVEGVEYEGLEPGGVPQCLLLD